MKNTSLLSNLVFAVSAFSLVALLGACNNESSAPVVAEAAPKADNGIVFINTDSLIIKYEYARQLSEELIRKEESSRTDFNERARVFQQDMVEFQRKVQNNGFLSLERAQSEERRLREKEQELQELNNRLSNDLMQHQERMNQQLRDTITAFLDGYSKEKGYRLVLSNTMGDNLLYGAPDLDITQEVVDSLNKRFEAGR
ncbi:MAG TPA: OmpH family outer membrane protein [Bacteroidales bacterium]|nr:OmpH family outer membrane protein [Bacteroidales bacterium]